MLFDIFATRSLQLANRMVMAPLTRSRATPQHTPNALMGAGTVMCPGEIYTDYPALTA